MRGEADFFADKADLNGCLDYCWAKGRGSHLTSTQLIPTFREVRL